MLRTLMGVTLFILAGSISEAGGLPAVEVTASRLNARSGPSTNTSVIAVLEQGQAYPEVRRSGPWAQLQLGGQLAWCHGDFLVPGTQSVVTVTATSLNVRSGAGTAYRTLGQLSRGQSVAILAARGVWREISYRGRGAWVHGSFLRGSGAGVSASPTQSPASAPRRSRAGLIQLPVSGLGYYAYGAAYKRWGTERLVYAVERIARRWARESRARLGIGNISLENGGYMAPHSSHQRGVDVDVIPVRRDGREDGVTIYQSAYSRQLTQRVIDLFHDELSTRVILFNDPTIRGVMSWAGHDNHFHVSVN